MPKYPTKDELWKLFAHMGTGDYETFFNSVSDQVEWTIMGTSPLSEVFPDLKTFQEKTLKRLRKILKDPGLYIQVQNVIGGGDQEWASVEMKAQDGLECIDGQPYNMVYNWVCRFDEQGKIVQVRAYLDTMLLTQVMRDNECPNYRPSVTSYT